MLRRIAENLLPRKEILDALLVPAIIVLVGLGAFGLGRLSRVEEAKSSASAGNYPPTQTP